MFFCINVQRFERGRLKFSDEVCGSCFEVNCNHVFIRKLLKGLKGSLSSFPMTHVNYLDEEESLPLFKKV